MVVTWELERKQMDVYSLQLKLTEIVGGLDVD